MLPKAIVSLSILIFVQCLVVLRTLPRGVTIFGSALFILLALSIDVSVNLISIKNVSSEIDLLIDDSIVGIDSADEMRALLRDMRISILLQGANSRITVDPSDLLEFRDSFQHQLAVYLKGAYTLEDRKKGNAIEVALKEYTKALSLITRQSVVKGDLQDIDQKASKLAGAINAAYAYNKHRLNSLALKVKEESELSMRNAKTILVTLFASFGLLSVVFIVSKYFLVPFNLRTK